MKNNNGFLVIGMLINAGLTLFMKASERYEVLFIPSLIFLLICIIGWIAILANKVKIGAILYIIGCVMFVPLSIVGIIGAKKVMNQKKVDKFLKDEYGNN